MQLVNFFSQATPKRMFLEEELNLGCWGPANLTRAKFSRQNRPLREASPVFK